MSALANVADTVRISSAEMLKASGIEMGSACPTNFMLHVSTSVPC